MGGGSSSYKGTSRDISGSSGSGHLGGSSYMGGSTHMSSSSSSRDMGGMSHMSGSSRGLSGGRDMGGSRADLGRSTTSDYSRSREERAPARALHGGAGGGSSDVPSHTSRSNMIGSHASGGSSWSSAITGTSGGLAADWSRSAMSGDRSGAAGLSSRSISGMGGMSAMGLGVGVSPFGGGALPCASGSMSGGSMGGGGGADRYDAYTLKNSVLGTRRY